MPRGPDLGAASGPPPNPGRCGPWPLEYIDQWPGWQRPTVAAKWWQAMTAPSNAVVVPGAVGADQTGTELFAQPTPDGWLCVLAYWGAAWLPDPAPPPARTIRQRFRLRSDGLVIAETEGPSLDQVFGLSATGPTPELSQKTWAIARPGARIAIEVVVNVALPLNPRGWAWVYGWLYPVQYIANVCACEINDVVTQLDALAAK